MKKVTLEQIYEMLQDLHGLQGLRGLPKRIDDLEKSIDQRFARQFAYFDNKFKEIERRFETMPTRDQFDRWIATLDVHTGQLVAQEHELGALTAQTHRHEKWIQKLARSMAHYLKMS